MCHSFGIQHTHWGRDSFDANGIKPRFNKELRDRAQAVWAGCMTDKQRESAAEYVFLACIHDMGQYDSESERDACFERIWSTLYFEAYDFVHSTVLDSEPRYIGKNFKFARFSS